MNPPELLARLRQVALCRLKSLDRCRSGDPATADRFDHRQGFQRMRRIAEVLMSSVKLLTLLLRELLRLTTYLHVAPSEQRVPVGPYDPTVAQRDRPLRSTR